MSPLEQRTELANLRFQLRNLEDKIDYLNSYIQGLENRLVTLEQAAKEDKEQAE